MTGPADPAPLIVSLALDAASQQRFDELRQRHFPVERNHLAAHVTVFHALPAEQVAQIEANLQACAPPQPIALTVTGLRFLGRGVAYDLASDDVQAWRAALVARWRPWLTAQDRQPWRPHVTVQNKVSPERARALHASLRSEFVAYPVTVEGVALWRYRGGPWEHVRTFPWAVRGGPYER